jgi:hypothetical protein
MGEATSGRRSVRQSESPICVLLNDSFEYNISDWGKYESQIDGGDPHKAAGASLPGFFGPDESTAVTRTDEWEDEFEPLWAEIEKLAAFLLVPEQIVTVGNQGADDLVRSTVVVMAVGGMGT